MQQLPANCHQFCHVIVIEGVAESGKVEAGERWGQVVDYLRVLILYKTNYFIFFVSVYQVFYQFDKLFCEVLLSASIYYISNQTIF